MVLDAQYSPMHPTALADLFGSNVDRKQGGTSLDVPPCAKQALVEQHVCWCRYRVLPPLLLECRNQAVQGTALPMVLRIAAQQDPQVGSPCFCSVSSCRQQGHPIELCDQFSENAAANQELDQQQEAMGAAASLGLLP